MTIGSIKMLGDYISSSNKIELTESVKEEITKIDPKIAEQVFAANRIEYGRSAYGNGLTADYINFKTTPRDAARTSKGIRAIDQREEFINGWDVTRREVEVYRRDPIPLCTYRSMSFDTKIKMASKLICGFISRLQFDIVSSDPKKAALVHHALSPHYNQLIRDMAKIGMQNGWMMAEKVWERRTVKVYDQTSKELMYSGRAIVPSKIKTLDPENRFRYWIDSRSDDLVRIEQIQGPDVVYCPRKKIFWFALNKEYSNIFGTSSYQSAYQAWYYGNGIEQALLMKLDTTGEPILIVRFPPGNNLRNGQMVSNDVIASELALEVQNQKVIELPTQADENGNMMWDLTYLELKNAENEPYMKALDYFDKKKVEALGVFANIIAGEANFSEIDAKEDLTLVLIEDMVDQIESAIQVELVDWITSYNFGPKHIDDVRIRIDRNSLGRSKMLQTMMIEMMRIAASDKTARPKSMPDLEKMGNMTGIPMAPYDQQMDRSMLDKQMEAEKKMQPKPVAGVKPTGKSAVKEAQSKEDSNNRNRKTVQVRDRGRPSAQEK